MSCGVMIINENDNEKICNYEKIYDNELQWEEKICDVCRSGKYVRTAHSIRLTCDKQPHINLAKGVVLTYFPCGKVTDLISQQNMCLLTVSSIHSAYNMLLVCSSKWIICEKSVNMILAHVLSTCLLKQFPYNHRIYYFLDLWICDEYIPLQFCPRGLWRKQHTDIIIYHLDYCQRYTS